jgi:hypothetical protein
MLSQHPQTQNLILFKAEALSSDSMVHVENSSLITTLTDTTLLVENVAHQDIPLSFFRAPSSLTRCAKSFGVLTMHELLATFQTLKNPYLLSDFFVRLSFCLLPFLLTLVGTVFSLHSKEKTGRFNMGLLVLFASLCLMSVLTARAFRSNLTICIVAALLPLVSIPATWSYRRYEHL